MINSTFLAVVLGVMAGFVFVCLVCVFVLIRSVKSLQATTAKGEHAVTLEDSLSLAVRVRAGLTAGVLALAGVVLICATVITCIAITKS